MKNPFKKGNEVTVGKHSDVVYTVEKVHKFQVQIREKGTAPNGHRFTPHWIDHTLLVKVN